MVACRDEPSLNELQACIGSGAVRSMTDANATPYKCPPMIGFVPDAHLLALPVALLLLVVATPAAAILGMLNIAAIAIRAGGTLRGAQTKSR
jgi:hypothetical protein